MYLSIGFPLSPASEYSSDSNLSNYTHISLMPGCTPSPPPSSPYYNDCPPLTTALPAHHHHHHDALPHAPAYSPSADPTSVYPLQHHRSASYALPSRLPLPAAASTSYAAPTSYYASSYAPSTSATHPALGAASVHDMANRAQSYTTNPVAPPSAAAPYDLYHPLDHLTAVSPVLEKANGTYSPSGSVGASAVGAKNASVAPFDDSHSFAIPLPTVTDILTSAGIGPDRRVRSSGRAAPYPSAGSARRAFSPRAYQHSASDALHPTTSTAAESPTDSPRRPSRSSQRKGSASGNGQPAVLEKNFVCKMCDARFARNHDLTRHHKVHNPIKAYKCRGCERRFTRKDALKRHATQKNCGIEQEDDVDAAAAVPAPETGSRSRGSRRTEAEPASVVYHQQPAAVPTGLQGHSADLLASDDSVAVSSRAYAVASSTMIPGGLESVMAQHPQRRSARQTRSERYTPYYGDYQ